jgi:hypothetical protein
MLICISCRLTSKTSSETPFFSDFSVRELVESAKSSAGFTCDPIGGGGGGSDFNMIGGTGPGGTRFNYYKGDSFTCRLKSNEPFDEAALFSTLRVSVERALQNNGAQVTDSGSSRPADFYFAYVWKNVRGRVQVSGTRIGTDNYNVHADLQESNK